jgi:hypothetical protein
MSTMLSPQMKTNKWEITLHKTVHSKSK